MPTTKKKPPTKTSCGNNKYMAFCAAYRASTEWKKKKYHLLSVPEQGKVLGRKYHEMTKKYRGFFRIEGCAEGRYVQCRKPLLSDNYNCFAYRTGELVGPTDGYTKTQMQEIAGNQSCLLRS